MNALKRIGALCTLLVAMLLPAMAGSPKRMKVISYNIEYGMRADTTKNKQVFAAWVREQDPDILCLQETNYFTQKSLQELAASYGHPYAILGKEEGFPTAITSKYPIVNVQKVTDNMWHGCVIATINGYHVVSLHLSPHQYKSRWNDIDFILETIRQSGPFKKWLIMGDFNSVSPLDSAKYADGKYAERLHNDELKRPKVVNHLVDGKLDYTVHRRILDFGFVDAARSDKRFSTKDFGARIDFIYYSPDMKKGFKEAGFITDAFTRKYSDHRPVYMVWDAKE